MDGDAHQHLANSRYQDDTGLVTRLPTVAMTPSPGVSPNMQMSSSQEDQTFAFNRNTPYSLPPQQESPSLSRQQPVHSVEPSFADMHDPNSTYANNMYNTEHSQHSAHMALLGNSPTCIPPPAISAYGNPYMLQQSNSNGQDRSKRKREDDHTSPAQPATPLQNANMAYILIPNLNLPPRALSQVMGYIPPMANLKASPGYGQIPTGLFMHNAEPVRATYPSSTTIDTNLNSPKSAQLSSPSTNKRPKLNSTVTAARTTMTKPPAILKGNSEETVQARQPSGNTGSRKVTADTHMQLCFELDLYPLHKSCLFFMTVGDKFKAQGRGFQSAIDVYTERCRRPNIETTDINLAWVPGLEYNDASLPWQPICGPAAYIAALRSDLKMKFVPGEPVVFKGEEYEPDQEMNIPMLHDFEKGLWNRTNHCRTTYAYQHNKNSEQLSFMPSQAEWTPENLPPSAAILEPMKISKSEVPTLVDRHNVGLKDAHGSPRRAFDHILPARVPSTIDGWLLAAWVAEDPRIQWRDIEAHMDIGKETAKLGERYSRYRESVSGMTRGAPSTNEKAATKMDVKAARQHHDKLVSNSWWYVDVSRDIMCQSKDPMRGLVEKLAVYPLPMRKGKKQDNEYSERVSEALKVVSRKAKAQSEDSKLYEALGTPSQHTE